MESRAGSGGNYKSKEYISTSESSSDEDKPLKKKTKKDDKKEKKEKKRKKPDTNDREKEVMFNVCVNTDLFAKMALFKSA